MERLLTNSDLRPKGFVVVCTECKKPARAQMKISAQGMSIVASVSFIKLELVCTSCGKRSIVFLE